MAGMKERRHVRGSSPMVNRSSAVMHHTGILQNAEPWSLVQWTVKYTCFSAATRKNSLCRVLLPYFLFLLRNKGHILIK